MEFKKHWLPYKQSNKSAKDGEIINDSLLSWDSDDTKKAENELTKLLNQGWMIVSTCPIIGTSSLGIPKSGYNSSKVFTQGIEVFLVKK